MRRLPENPGRTRNAGAAPELGAKSGLFFAPKNTTGAMDPPPGFH